MAESTIEIVGERRLTKFGVIISCDESQPTYKGRWDWLFGRLVMVKFSDNSRVRFRPERVGGVITLFRDLKWKNHTDDVVRDELKDWRRGI